ncbi:hypothetical protein ALX04_006385 [Lactiplantibacillus plantarum subsp. plantarum]|uniref:hypothetical protein n=1 Tax=Lactiplantibacillus plantarum TaxID=1590 RepID=UPI0006A719DA|nr:hypothetical protein [Lactiplantibacillus plantarum]ASI63315.1 hypothetical protein ALX04_006385 [Lactiplantibacillus plantarum subsp. plantarum]KAE9508183.1 hypothetical protein FET70_01639 [Lactiplantibacillus plantarum]UOC07861.1 hypothetical protein LGQ11_10250 [Lactiplantibacillus plantarum]
MEKMTVQELSQATRKLKAKFDAHDGSNGDANSPAHLPATFERDGFESAADKVVIDSRAQTARTTTELDVMNLDFGRWIATGYTNGPKTYDGHAAMVTVSGQGSFKHINFMSIATGQTFVRDVYATHDTGWADTSWINLVPTNGFTGKLQVKSNDMQSTRLIEVQFDLTCSIKSSDTITFGTLPAGFPPLDAASEPMYFPCRGALDDKTNVLASVYLTAGNELTVFRTDGAYPDKSLVAVSGYFSYTR